MDPKFVRRRRAVAIVIGLLLLSLFKIGRAHV
jgi:hypothetical protein